MSIKQYIAFLFTVLPVTLRSSVALLLPVAPRLPITLLLALTLLAQGCHSPNPATPPVPPPFKALDHSNTGLNFSNTLHPTTGFNVFDYMYFYNGSGVGAGDFNNDGLIDLFFASNQGDNKLYLNTGNLRFRDVTDSARIPQDHGWSTGVSVVDINNDGLLDIYICRVGQLEGLPASRNQLLICQGIGKDGIPIYRDEAAEYGLDFSGFSTQAAFFDYDGDGYLDMFLMNHSIHQNGTFGPRQEKLATFNPLSGDRLFRNQGNGKFVDVTKQAGIHSSVIGYGLGLDIADINLDGYPDIYVGNDFHENDYLYINQHNGAFHDEGTDRMMHTSQFSMGVDIADASNDGFPEIITMDMLPYDPYILKRSEGEDTWDIFNLKISYGYNYQYTRNNLQYNRRNGHFSEIGLYSGVAATDWSWSPLWVDFNNDGLKDLFVSNGIPKRLNDIDYIDFVLDDELQRKMANRDLTDKDLAMINKFPEIKLPSKFFDNTGQMQFTDISNTVQGIQPSFSNGAVAVDLDNDGDLDLVVNNIDQPVTVYQNLQNEHAFRPAAEISLRGPQNNINALGAKLFLFTGGEIHSYEKYPVHGFLSSAETPLHVGLYGIHPDSVFLVWPDNSFQRISLPAKGGKLNFTYTKGLPHFDYSIVTNFRKNPTRPMEDITSKTNLLYRHEENQFPEFDREPLIPHMLSTEGPAVAVGDLNHDGRTDVFIGGAKWKKPAVFIQDAAGRYSRLPEPDLDTDSTYEAADACFTDVDGDGNPDLVEAPGGNEFYGQEPWRRPQVYLNDGKGGLHRSEQAFPDIWLNASCVAPYDFNKDGAVDLFIGGRSVPFNYGQIPQSYLLRNDGKGHFTDVTARYAKELANIGFVTSAQWFDLDNDGTKDLLLSLEWGGIIAFLDKGDHFEKKVLCDKKGWWNFILPVDLDRDGNVDLVVGNLGLNSRLTASPGQPVRLYYYDFDGNGKKEQVLTYYLAGRELPFANKQELEKQMPGLKKNFLYAGDFAKATLEDMFTRSSLEKADTLTAEYFANAILVNQGNLTFNLQAMPWEAQLSSFRDAVVVNANNDSLPDLLLVGNYFENNIQMGRYDADYGTILINHGKHSFSANPLNGLVLKGQVRHLREIDAIGKKAWLAVRNNDSAFIFRFTP
ncbi:VCBS repeat-containing protein [Puia dinghuensis]|uniref:ASPIC/UnbV domain-containing protein n=1 Tax=Puia dinghuensis TaxID=1792502 RepID=A0A8J2UGS0_9BACT|nr:VCBS repeat-containing protein [Puia dinghuensis]GGB14932.1 hypothetical protein GCM10011511_43350 [Puia dinghuensis]